MAENGHSDYVEGQADGKWIFPRNNPTQTKPYSDSKYDIFHKFKTCIINIIITNGKII